MLPDLAIAVITSAGHPHVPGPRLGAEAKLIPEICAHVGEWYTGMLCNIFAIYL